MIDVNIPELITVSDPNNPKYNDTEVEYASTATDVARREGEKLASYLWENYIEPYDFPGGIFLIGAGNAFHAIAKLVSENGMCLSFPSRKDCVIPGRCRRLAMLGYYCALSLTVYEPSLSKHSMTALICFGLSLNCSNARLND